MSRLDDADAAQGPQRVRKTGRTLPSRNDPLPEPILIAEFKKNRAGDIVRVYLKSYEGHALIDVRTWWPDGAVRKPGKGFACLAKHLPTLLAAFTKATARARELGLIEAEPATSLPENGGG